MKILSLKEVVTRETYNHGNAILLLWTVLLVLATTLGLLGSIMSLLAPSVTVYHRWAMGQIGYVIILIAVAMVVRQIKDKTWPEDKLDWIFFWFFVWGLLPYTLVAWALTNVILIVGQSVAWIFVNFWRILLWMFLVALGGAGLFLLAKAIFGF
ncbi:MAG: hypothetical protein WCG48_00575 [Candidatus Berkelbacteria bacterium]